MSFSHLPYYRLKRKKVAKKMSYLVPGTKCDIFLATFLGWGRIYSIYIGYSCILIFWETLELI